MKRLWKVVLAAAIATSWSAAAQENSLTGIIGRTFISDQGIKGATFSNPVVHFGNGLTFEVNYGRHLLGQGFTKVYFEVPAVFDFDQDIATGANVIPGSYKSIFVTPGLRANLFATTAVQPWVSIGGGWGYFNPGSTLLYGGPSPAGSSNTGVMQFGGGLEVRFKPRWAVRGGVRDFWSGTPNLNVDTGRSRQHNFFVGGGIVWFFGK